MKTVPLPFGNAIFCDDVRYEAGNKQSYMGIYGADMIFPDGTTFPILVPKLCVVFRWHEEADFSEDLKFHLLYLTGEKKPFNETLIMTIDIPLKDHIANVPKPLVMGKGDHRLAVGPTAAIAPFHIAEPGRLSARVERLGEIWRVGSLRIGVEPSAGPSSQQ